MTQGCTLTQYEQILDALTETGLIRQDGQLIDSTPKGKSFLLLASKG
jgi:predicted transcriptional regulator